jgi:hypothetical protein
MANPPLNPSVRIVDDQGRPTPEFMRWAQSQADVNTTIPALSTGSQVSAILDKIGSVVGSLLYRSSTAWSTFGPGSSGQFLKSNGASSAPSWAVPATGATAFTGLSDVPSVYTGDASKVVSVKSDESGLEFVTPTAGATAFTGLSDVPSAYTGAASKVVSVKSDESGLEFTTASGGGGGGLTLIDRQVLSSSATTITFASIAGTFDHLKLILSARSTGTGTQEVFVQFNGDTGTNYRSDRENRFGYNGGVGQTKGVVGEAVNSSFAANFAAQTQLLLPDYAATTFYKGYVATSNIPQSASPGSYTEQCSGVWLSTAAVTQIDITLTGGASFVAGTTASLYGI